MDVSVNVKSALAQVPMVESLCEIRATAVIATHGGVADTCGWRVCKEDISRSGDAVVNGFALASVVLECSHRSMNPSSLQRRVNYQLNMPPGEVEQGLLGSHI